MTVPPATDNTPIPTGRLHEYLDYLRLPYVREHHATLAQEAAERGWPHVQYLETLIEGEAHLREDRRTQRRVMLARFPVLKTLDQFNWSWPKKINRLQVQNLFRLKFIEDKANVIFLGGVGLGKSHLATALGYAACLQGYSVRFTTAIDAINTLSAAHGSGRLKIEIKKYLKPRVLILDELGYLPIDKNGADLLFQVISGRYERGSLIITSNRAFKKWPEIFNNDSTLTSALLDRLLHHAETLIIESTSYRMKDQPEA
jgi:DNA replication protein DnaC